MWLAAPVGMDKPDKRYSHTRTRTEQGERTPRLPHEHDESSDSQAGSGPHEVMRQAHDDVRRLMLGVDEVPRHLAPRSSRGHTHGPSASCTRQPRRSRFSER